jgi:hypothetical protein
MLTRTLFVFAVVVALCGTVALGQQKSTAPSSSPLREFPVVLQQNVEAGKTPVGTKVQAKLAVATTFHGVVIPRNAVVTGVVFESVRKSATAPSRLGIRMENAKWKDEATCMMKAYLMPLYYPMVNQAMQGPPVESSDTDSRSMSGSNQSSPMSQPSFGGSNSEAAQEAMPNLLTLASRPVSMKNVIIEPVPDNGVALVSEHENIKLHKMTTYVLAGIETPAK